jgi:lysophospholipase L1-like esterase
VRGWIKKFVLLTAVSILSLIALEALLLIFNDYVFHSSFFIFDPDLGFRVRPYAVFGSDRTNEFGFNDRDYSHNRMPGTYRIVVLGDSFSWMGGLDRNYVSLLEKRFEEEFGLGKVEVINAGYSQTHTGEQLALLKKFALQYQPDQIVLAVFAGNDFYDADPRRTRIAVGGGMMDVFADRDLYLVLFGQPVVMQSRLLLFLQEKWRSWEKRSQVVSTRQAKTSSKKSSSTCKIPLSSYYLNSLYLRTQFYRHDRRRDFEPNVELIRQSILEMERICSSNSISFAVAVFPDEIQVDAEVRRAFLEHYGMESKEFEWGRAQSILRQLCTTRGIDYIDLYPGFLAGTESGRKHYLPNNGHWNDLGNELAAEILTRKLRGHVQFQPGS